MPVSAEPAEAADSAVLMPAISGASEISSMISSAADSAASEEAAVHRPMPRERAQICRNA